MARKLSDWLQSYNAYTIETESAPLFNKWCGISAIAGALRKKCWLDVGRLRVYPNLFSVLVAEPGVLRKSQAINYVSEIINNVPAIKTGPDSLTAFGLMDELVDATTYETVGDKFLHHASLTVLSKEFESFIGNSSKLLVTLTDLYDAGENHWKHRTQSGGMVAIPSVFLNVLGATTPGSLSDRLSHVMTEGGLASRILFIHTADRAKKIAFPRMDTELLLLRCALTEDLNEIASMAGAFQYDTLAADYWTRWYNSYDHLSPTRIEKNKKFNGWYSRKPLMIQKLCVVCAASRGSQVVNVQDIDQSISLIEEVERGMGGFALSSSSCPTLLHLIREHESISEKHLLQLVWREINQEEFDKRITVLLKNKEVYRRFESPEGKSEIWYHYSKEKLNNGF